MSNEHVDTNLNELEFQSRHEIIGKIKKFKEELKKLSIPNRNVNQQMLYDHLSRNIADSIRSLELDKPRINFVRNPNSKIQFKEPISKTDHMADDEIATGFAVEGGKPKRKTNKRKTNKRKTNKRRKSYRKRC